MILYSVLCLMVTTTPHVYTRVRNMIQRLYYTYNSKNRKATKKLSESSDSEPEPHGPAPRLRLCEVCGANEAQYTCPKCEVKTCCLKCVRIHKMELKCAGLRDRTKFVRVKDFTDRDLLSDYRLLEECARFVYGVKRDDKKRFTRIDKDLPVHLFKLKMATRDRGVALQFLAQNFARHSKNTTICNYKTNLISWRVEWIFPNAEPQMVKFVDEKCLETVKLLKLLGKYLDLSVQPFDGSKVLTYYNPWLVLLCVEMTLMMDPTLMDIYFASRNVGERHEVPVILCTSQYVGGVLEYVSVFEAVPGQSPHNMTIRIYNSLPKEISGEIKYNIFTQKLKKYLNENCFYTVQEYLESNKYYR